MRVCVLGLRGIPDVVGGIETHCQQLFPRLKALLPAFDFTVIGRRQYMPAPKYDYRSLHLVGLWHLRGRQVEAITNSLAGVFYARFKLRSDIVHIHAIGPGLVGPIAKLLGMKLIVTHHGADYDRAKWGKIAKFFLRLGERLAVSSADCVIAVSPSLQKSLQARYPASRDAIVYIPNGANHLDATPARSDAVLDKYGLRGRPYILSVGRIVPEKGFHDLVEAFRAADTDARLVIAGGGQPGDPYFQRLTAAAGERIVFTGNLPHSDISVLLKNTALFVLASHHEGLPIAALEAAMSGAPVLVSDIQPNRDLQFDAKHYFPVGNVAKLRAALDRDLSSYGLADRSLLSGFDWDVVARQTSRVYTAQAKGAALSLPAVEARHQPVGRL